jgi:hypothetical protein
VVPKALIKELAKVEVSEKEEGISNGLDEDFL